MMADTRELQAYEQCLENERLLRYADVIRSEVTRDKTAAVDDTAILVRK